MLLDDIHEPADLRTLSQAQLTELAAEIRTCIVDRVTVNGGHLGSNLGAVELTLAIHRVFDSPRDVILWDTGHQAYVHKLVTGRKEGFATLRQPGGMSGYPSRAESPHDWIENSHASTALSYAHGIAMGLQRRGEHDRHVVAVLGRRVAHGGHGLRGTEQPRPRRHPGRHRAQRQRAVVRADGVAAVGRPHAAAPEPVLRPCPRAGPPRAARHSWPRWARVLEPARPHRARCARS